MVLALLMAVEDGPYVQPSRSMATTTPLTSLNANRATQALTIGKDSLDRITKMLPLLAKIDGQE